MSDQEKPDIASLRIPRDPLPQTEGPRKFPWTPTIVVIVLLALLGGAWMFMRGGQTAQVETVTAVMTFPSQANAVLTANGYVVAQRKAAVASKGMGRLLYLGVEEGDHVKEGQIIARLEDGDVIAQLARARANLAMALADSTDAQSTYERTVKLYDSKLVSQADLDGARARQARVMASIVSARASVQEAEVGLENTRIRAPFDGTVLTKTADVGEVVAPFASSVNSRGAVVTIADMGSLQVEADVSESNIPRVEVGRPCEITLDAYPEKRYRGVVHKIVPTADRAKATVLTKVAFAERDNRVLPEMSAKVAFLQEGTSDAVASAPARLTVPQTAVTERHGTQVVFVVRNAAVVETPVTTGERLGSLVSVTSGLKAGDVVVNRPAAELADGTKVTTK
jgi:RND family efflux transporter MFP subunit